MPRKTSKYNKNQPYAVQNLSRKKTTKTPRDSKNRKSRAKFECSSDLADLIRKANLVKNIARFSVEDYFEEQKKNTYYYEPVGLSVYNYFFSLSDELQGEVLGSNENTVSEKQDSFEYWLHLDGIAIDRLIDLNAEEQISDEDFQKLIDSDAYEIADFLVEYGLYGDDYSYKKLLKDQRKNTYVSDEDDNYNDISTLFDGSDVLYRAIEKIHDTRDFLLAVIALSEHYNQISDSNKNQEESFYSQRQREKISETAFQDKEANALKNRLLATSITVNQDGTIHFSISEWAKILQGVDITRIRLCEVCEDIFWAKRKDAFACSPKHSKVRQMRLLRKNWEEKGDLYLKARKKKAKR